MSPSGRLASAGFWSRRGRKLAAWTAVAVAAGAAARLLGAPWLLSAVVPAVLVLAGLVAQAVSIGRQSAIEQEQQDSEFALRTHVPPWTPVDDVDPTMIGVDAAAQSILPGEEVPEYVVRDIDAQLSDAIADGRTGDGPWLVVVSGASKVGKSRALFEALRRSPQELMVLAPTSSAALGSLLTPGQLPPAPSDGDKVLWLDDLEPFLNDGTTWRLLHEWHAQVGGIVVGTYGGKGSDHVAASRESNLATVADTVLGHATEIILESTTATELEPLPDMDRHEREAVERDGLAAYLVAAGKLQRKLATSRHSPGDPLCPAGSALVRAAIDWALTGRTDPVSIDALRAACQDELNTDGDLEQGLDWACRPVAGSIALLKKIGEDGYQPYDYIVRAAGAGRPVPETIWEAALQGSSPSQALTVGSKAYNLGAGEIDIARRAWTIASTSSHPEIAGNAYLNLGIIADRAGDRTRAVELFEAALATEHPACMTKAWTSLGIVYNKQGDVPRACDYLRQAMEAGEGYAAAAAAVGLGILLTPRDRDAAREAFETGIAFEQPHYSARATGLLGDLLRTQYDDPEGATAAYLEVVDDSDDPAVTTRATIGLAMLGHARGSDAAARRQLALAVEMAKPKRATQASLLLGGICARENDVAGAKLAFEKALELSEPGSDEAQAAEAALAKIAR